VKRALALGLTLLGAACASEELDDQGTAAAASSKVPGESRLTAPLVEISGLALRGSREVLAISDSQYAIGVGTFGAGGDLSFRTIDVKRLLEPGHHVQAAGAQWEAIASDGSGRMFVMEENPGRIFVFDKQGTRLEQVIRLDTTADRDLTRDWEKDPNSRGEGMLLLANGHVLVLKEKNPRRLVELGPAGEAPSGWKPGAEVGTRTFPQVPDTLTTLHVWELKAKAEMPDLSELAIGPGGRLYMLSDEGRAVARVAGNVDPATDAQLDFDAVWELKGIEKPEGLMFLSDGRALVASDIKTAADNLTLFTLPR
jgi:SdiA-regulated